MSISLEPLYMIGVVARKLKIHPQTLRLYEREELVVPKRTSGSTRLYSDFDIDCIREIQHLTQDLGLNLAGVKMIIQMRKRAYELEETIQKFEKEMEEFEKKMDEEIKKVHKSYKFEIMPYKRSSIVVRRSSKEER